MDIVTIDFETYYDKEYSLSKMTTEAYIRDPRFQIIGVSVRVNDYPADWYSGDNPGRFLKSLDYRDKAILCHHTAFDGAILSWLFDIKPKLWLDTLSMSRPHHNITVGGSLAKLAAYYGLGTKGTEVVDALGKRREDFTPQDLAKYGSYCVNDNNLTKALFDVLKVGFSSTELLVIDQTIRMYTEPSIALNRGLLEKHLAEVRQRKADLLAQLEPEGVDPTIGVVATLMSNAKFTERLRELGVDPPMKVSPTTGKMTPALSRSDKGMTDLLEHPDPRVQALVAARLGVKSTLEETRTAALIGVSERGLLPIMLNYYGAHTGRFSGGDKLNLQNLPSRGNNTIRRALEAPPGHVVIACDSAQIEARIVAWVAGQEDLVEAFRQKRDVYSEFASEIYGRAITKADKVERFVGKTCVLGLGYGMGAEKFRRTLEIGQGGISVKIDISEATRIVQIYRSKNFKIVQFWQRCASMLNAMLEGRDGNLHDVIPYDVSGIILPNNLRIQYPGLQNDANGFRYVSDARAYAKAAKARVLGEDTPNADFWTRIYGGKVTENLVQALAALTIREQMARCRVLGLRVAFQVHDEIVLVAPEESAATTQKILENVMSTPPKWAPDLPVACESGVATNYGDT